MTMPAATPPSPFFDPAHPNFEAFANPAVGADENSKQATLTRFAADNALTYTPFSQRFTYPGCIFSVQNTGELSSFRDHLSTTTGRFVDLGNFEPSGRLQVQPDGSSLPAPPQFAWGFVALQIDRQLPNLMLISKHRAAGSPPLPFTPDPTQKLSLEGNFDDYFTLYCPKEFEEDALYVFTPDLMALLMDDAAPFDVEIVDRWMFIYSSLSFDPLDEKHYRRIFQILETVGSKIVIGTSQFNDPNLAPAPVDVPVTGWHFVPNPAMVEDDSPAGTRLKPKSQLPALILVLGIAVVIVVAIIVYSTVTGTGHFG